jgi:hypothetical protein
MYSLSLALGTVVDLSTPVLAIENNVISISNIYIGSGSSAYASYTVSRDNGETQSDFLYENTYTDSSVEFGNIYTYSITYYTSTGVATTTLNLGSISMSPAEVIVSASNITYTSFDISYNSSSYAITETDVFDVVAAPASARSVIYPDPDYTYNGYAKFASLSSGTDYTVSITQTNSAGTTITTFDQSTMVSPPEYVVAIISTTNSIIINIATSVGAISYTAYAMRLSLTLETTTDYIYLTDIDNTPDINTDLVSATINGLTPGRTYEIYVYAIGTAGWLGTTTATGILTTLPESPTDVKAVSSSTTTISITFTGVSTAVSYIATITSADGIITTQPDIVDISVVLTGLSQGTYYQITIVAVNSAGDYSDDSLAVYARTIPGPPILGTVYNITTTSLSFPFTGATGAYSYSLLLEGIKTATTTTTTGITQSPVSLYSLTPGEIYNITMYTVNASGGVSIASNVIQTSTIALPPTELKAADITENSMTITFTESFGASSYVLYLIQTSTGDVLDIVPEILTSPVYLTSLSIGTSYSIKMFTVNAFGKQSADSTVLDTTTISASPTDLSVGSITSTSMYAYFTEAVNASSYTLILTNKLTNVSVSTPNITQTTIFLSALSSGVEYTLQLYTVNSAGISTVPASLDTITKSTIITNLSVSNITTTSMYVSFEDVGGAETYTITATPTSGTTAATEIITENLYCTFINLEPGMKYSLVMVATNSSGSSAPTDYIYETTIPGPTILGTASSSTSTTLSIPFNNTILGASSYFIIATETSSSTSSSTTSQTSPAILSANIIPGTQYSIVAQAYNDSGYSVNSNTVYVYSLCSAPAAAYISGITSSTLTVAITTTSVGATGYYIYASNSNNVIVSTATTQSGSLTATLSNLSSGITYNVYVKTINSSGTSVNALSLTGITLTDAPILQNTSQITDTSVWLTYTGVSNAVSYIVYATPYNITKDTITTTVAASTTQYIGLSMQITNLATNESYDIQMVAINAEGSASTGSNVLQNLLTIPAAPVLDKYTSTSPTNLNIYFYSTDNATAFILRYITSANVIVDTILTSNTSPVQITGLAAGNSYTIKIFATNITGTSSVSNYVSALTLPSPPSTLTATSTDATIITLAYSVPTSAAEYPIIAIPQTTGNLKTYTFNSNNVSLDGLSAGTLYTIQVYSKNAIGTSITYSSVLYSTIPSAPTLISPATIITATSLYVGYTESFGATSYNALAIPNIESSGNKSFTDIVSNPVQLTGLASGILYSITMTAKNSSGNSAISANISALTIPAAPVVGDITSPSSSSLQVEFAESTGATSYFVSGSYSNGPVVIYSNDESPISLTSLESGTAYNIQVYAQHKWKLCGNYRKIIHYYSSHARKSKGNQHLIHVYYTCI